MSNILVIDDEPGFRDCVRTYLKHRGHSVREAIDGDAGIREFRAKPADVVICDLIMPGREGLETIGELRRLSTDVRIIAISGGSVNVSGEQILGVAKVLGADVALRKPLYLQDLLEAIEVPVGLA